MNSERVIYKNIKNIITESRKNAYTAVNFSMVSAYWNIGKLLVEEEQRGESRAQYGKKLVKNLSQKLTQELGPGYSEQSLWNMRQFYTIFPILSTAWRELSWSHYKLLMRVENNKAREFYTKEIIESNWSVRALERQINSHYYERLLSSKDKSLLITEACKNADKEATNPRDFIKDPYILEFLDLGPNINYLEKDIEQALIGRLQNFLLELGRGFSFVGRQKRISTNTKDFYIDLVFYNYILKCFCLIDLKIGELTHQDIGQMDMYIRLYEDKIKSHTDNPTIGIILCAEKDETIVKYSALNENQQMFASKYKLYLPTEQELINELEREKKQLNLLLEKKEDV